MDPHLSSPNLDIKTVRMAGQPTNSIWDVCCKNGQISSLSSSELRGANEYPVQGLIAPSLCHPHIHLDKCFLLSHPKYADLEIKTGEFKEALTLTSKSTLLRPHVICFSSPFKGDRALFVTAV